MAFEAQNQVGALSSGSFVNFTPSVDNWGILEIGGKCTNLTIAVEGLPIGSSHWEPIPVFDLRLDIIITVAVSIRDSINDDAVIGFYVPFCGMEQVRVRCIAGSLDAAGWVLWSHSTNMNNAPTATLPVVISGTQTVKPDVGAVFRVDAAPGVPIPVSFQQPVEVQPTADAVFIVTPDSAGVFAVKPMEGAIFTVTPNTGTVFVVAPAPDAIFNIRQMDDTVFHVQHDSPVQVASSLDFLGAALYSNSVGLSMTGTAKYVKEEVYTVPAGKTLYITDVTHHSMGGSSHVGIYCDNSYVFGVTPSSVTQHVNRRSPLCFPSGVVVRLGYLSDGSGNQNAVYRIVLSGFLVDGGPNSDNHIVMITDDLGGNDTTTTTGNDTTTTAGNDTTTTAGNDTTTTKS